MENKKQSSFMIVLCWYAIRQDILVNHLSSDFAVWCIGIAKYKAHNNIGYERGCIWAAILSMRETWWILCKWILLREFITISKAFGMCVQCLGCVCRRWNCANNWGHIERDWLIGIGRRGWKNMGWKTARAKFLSNTPS